MQIKIQEQTLGTVQNQQELQVVTPIPIILVQRGNLLVHQEETHQKSNL